MYFYKTAPNSPEIHFAILTADGGYAEFSFQTFCRRFGVSLIRRFKDFFQNFRLDQNSDITFSEEFVIGDAVRMYFDLIRDHVFFRISTLKLRKIVRGIVHRHPRSVMTKEEIEYKKRGTLEPGKIGAERFNKLWKYLAYKKRGIQCPWITKEVDWWLKNKSESLAKKHMQMRLAVYYMALKNDFYDIESMLDARCLKARKDREESPTNVLFRL
jgi:hypothetical protein